MHALIGIWCAAAVVAAVATQLVCAGGARPTLVAPVGRVPAKGNTGLAIGTREHQPGHGAKNGDPRLLERLRQFVAQDLPQRLDERDFKVRVVVRLHATRRIDTANLQEQPARSPRSATRG